MTVPEELVLKRLKNSFRDGIFTALKDFDANTDAEKDVVAIHKEDFFKLLFQIVNRGGTNGLTFSFYGANVDDESHGTDNPYDPPPEYDPKVYFPLPEGIGTVDHTETDARIVTDNWTWILMRVKSAVEGNNTEGTLHVRGV